MNKLERNIYKSKIFYISIYLIYSIIVTMVSLMGNGFLNILVMTIGMILIGHFGYNDSKSCKLYYLIFSAGFFLCDGLAAILTSLIIQTTSVYIGNTAYYPIVLVISIRLMEFIYARFAIGFMNRRKISGLKFTQFIGFMIIPIFSIVYMFTLLSYMKIYAGIEEIVLFIINAIMIFIVNIYVTYMFENISKNNVLQNEINLYQQQSKLQYKYYDNLERKYQDSRKLAHDIRNHLNTIEELHKINDTETAKHYTDDIHKMLNELNQKYYTSNRVLNIILNEKFNYTKDKDINIECRIGDVNLEFIRDIDITTIFANLLDNAIEATKDKGYINLDINKFNELLVINISNSITTKPMQKNKKFKSTKENHQGLGIENIKKSLKKYDGTMLINFDESEFKVNIIIPM
ncbi:sensor histidine kinase [[Clostridium] dakarense]|uniref:sensor histidine kinase n=1 Tax=Faecalimicrobium dakarense TaxID=1301100 RepID=UPI0006941712|nr:sensor histidine kinase [[Clostridium] dakarense]